MFKSSFFLPLQASRGGRGEKETEADGPWRTGNSRLGLGLAGPVSSIIFLRNCFISCSSFLFLFMGKGAVSLRGGAAQTDESDRQVVLGLGQGTPSCSKSPPPLVSPPLAPVALAVLLPPETLCVHALPVAMEAST